MAKFCTNCGSPMDDAAAFCSSCGKGAGGVPPSSATAPPVAATTTSGGLSDNIAGMLAYVTIIPAIVFLVVAPYNRNRFVRFHSFQCLFLAVAWIILHIAIGILPFIHFVLWSLLSIVGLVLWIVLLLKAYQGEKWKLPVVGDIAEKQADAV
jgi:uncharacterized membrane protein